MALRIIRETAGKLKLSDLHRGLCEAALLLFRMPADTYAILRAARAARSEPRAAPLIAIGLFNTLHDANAENDLGRRDTLLEELRALARAHDDDLRVRDYLARGLVHTLLDAKAENDLSRRDALLDEVRALPANHPDDAFVQEVGRRVAETMTGKD